MRGLSLEMPDKSVSVASSPGAASSVGFTYGFMAVVLLFLLPCQPAVYAGDRLRYRVASPHTKSTPQPI